MTENYDTANFTAQRVIDRIYEEPELSKKVLLELIDQPTVSAERSKAIGDQYEDPAAGFLHFFLAKVINNLDYYSSIDLSDEVKEKAATDEEMQKHITQIHTKHHRPMVYDKELESERKERIALSKRANELYALTRLVIIDTTNQKPEQKRA